MVAVLTAYPSGLVATLAALTIQTLVLQAVIMRVTAGALDVRFGDLVRPFVRIAVATAIMAVGVALAVVALREAGVGNVGILLVGIVTGAMIFLALLLRLEPELIAELKGFARRGHRATDAREQGPSGQGSGLVPAGNASR